MIYVMFYKYWGFESSVDLISFIRPELLNKTYLFDSSKTELDAIESYVSCIRNFYIETGITNTSSIFEFWIRSSAETNFHFDCDENKRSVEYVYPTLSNVCYLNDHTCPLIVTDIDMEKYKYKKFGGESECLLIFPKKNTLLQFEGSKMHGVRFSADDRYILAINIWDAPPSEVPIYIPLCDSPAGSLTKFAEIELPDETHVIDDSLLDDMLYHGQIPFGNITESCRIIDPSKQEKCDLKKCILDIYEVDVNEMSIHNRFLQRGVVRSVFSKESCEWMIRECEDYAKVHGWTTSRHMYYPTTDIPVKNIPSIFTYFLNHSSVILDNICFTYGLTNYFSLNVYDLFIVKYEEHLQSELEFHHDGSLLSFNILLSNPSTFVGGGTMFQDGVKYNVGQGDMLMHCGKSMHKGVRITSGKRYVLVAFIKISQNMYIEEN